MTPEYESNGYGFICFENPDSATRALEATEQKKLPEGVVLDEERIEDLTRVFPLQYLSMFEQFSKSKK